MALENERAVEKHLFRSWWIEQVRFSDIDVNNHVNNVAYLNIVQTPRVAFLRGLLEEAKDPGSWIIGHVSVDYLRSVPFPAELEIGTGCEQIGTTSTELAQAIFYNDQCAAAVKSVMVHLQGEDRMPSPIEGRLRSLLAYYSINAKDGRNHV